MINSLLIPAQWDVESFLTNAKDYVELIGAAFLMLLGTVAVIYGGYLLIKKLMAGQQNQDSWVKIVMLIIIGGALMTGGFVLIQNIGQGGETTIRDLGEGFALPLMSMLGR